MIRRLEVEWPDPTPFVARGDQPIRLLAVSDEPEPALEHERNRHAIGPVDAIVGCGDLSPWWLAFLCDAFGAPIIYIRGNHDHGGAWTDRSVAVPAWLQSGHIGRVAGLAIGGLEWPGVDDPDNQRRPLVAWQHAFGLAGRRAVRLPTGHAGPLLVISHAPPKGFGDAATDPYHVGFDAYLWLLRRLTPPLWLHGHTTTAMVHELEVRAGSTTVVNVTGAVVVNLQPPAASPP